MPNPFISFLRKIFSSKGTTKMADQGHIGNEASKPDNKPIGGPPDPLQFSFCVEQKPGSGEDSQPIISISSARNQGLIGVFDGMGGAGSAVHMDRGIKRTGAYIAARLAHDAVNEFFNSPDISLHFPRDLNATTSLAQQLRKWLIDVFKKEATRSEQAPTRLAGTMIRHLPTTMACLCFEGHNSATSTYATFWAGDSRVYLLKPISGLQQISIDDLKSRGDALQNLVDDSPISNCINADGDFTVNCCSGWADLPVIYIVATDGCFNFVPSPQHFEYAILHSLVNSHSSFEWADRLRTHLASIAGDDLSIALVALGWTDFKQLQTAFEARTEIIWKDYVRPLDELGAAIAKSAEEHKKAIEQRDHVRSQLWNKYKKTYESLQQQRVGSQNL